MTKEEILAMEPGCDLDAQVARLLGKTVYKNWQGRWRIQTTLRSCDRVPPLYSKEIAAAWEVIRKLREEHWCIEIKIADSCWVIMELFKTPPVRIEVNGGTTFEQLPEAICKAALLAEEVGEHART